MMRRKHYMKKIMAHPTKKKNDTLTFSLVYQIE